LTFETPAERSTLAWSIYASRPKKHEVTSLLIVGRLKPGISVERASVDLNLVFQQIFQQFLGGIPGQDQSAEESRRVGEDTRSAIGVPFTLVGGHLVASMLFGLQ